MAPRNNDTDANYKKIACPDDADIDINKTIPSLLHKKHRVVKLVKSQLMRIQQEGLYDCGQEESGVYLRSERMTGEMRDMPGTSKGLRSPMTRDTSGEAGENRLSPSESSPRSTCLFCYLLAFFLATLSLIFLIVWISIGPLSNSMPHTPIPATSFVRHDSICSLEKKYLLRWSKPEYFE